jgi:cytochrome c-type protein NapC
MDQNEPRSSKKMWGLGAAIFVAGIIFYGIFGVVLEATNTTEFCTSCHSMKTNLKEMQERVHYQSASGVAAGCADCHVPKSLGPKLWAKFMAAKDVFHEVIGTINTQEKYEAHRWDMANRVWAKMKASDSRECQDCHSFDSMDFPRQSRSASKQHSKVKKARDQLASGQDVTPEIQEQAAKTCIDCHKGIAHEEPVDPSELEDIEADEEEIAEDTTIAPVAEAEDTTTAPAVETVETKDTTDDVPAQAEEAIVAEPAVVTEEPVKEEPVEEPVKEESEPVAVAPQSTEPRDGPTLAKEECEVCHGSTGNSEYEQVPNIAGLSHFYFVETMKSYRKGDRPSEKFKPEGHDETDMKTVLAGISDQEVEALAEYFEGQDFEPREQDFDSKLAKKGKLPYRKHCKKCHSENGSEPSDDAGILAGQSTPYLKAQLNYFIEGTRTQDDKMALAMKKLKEGDLEKLLNFFAQQQ